MGCGISREMRIIMPIGKSIGGEAHPNLAWGSPNGHIKAEPLVTNVGAQTEEELSIWGLAEAEIQTDPYPDDGDWYPMEVELSRVPSLSDMETQTSGNLVSVQVQTEVYTAAEVVWVRTSDRGRQDAAVQVARPRTHRYVQTVRTESSKNPSRSAAKVRVDLETQTDPQVRSTASGSASPLDHIGRELIPACVITPNGPDSNLARLLLENAAYNDYVPSRTDAETQTLDDPVTDEAPEYAAVPPPSKKSELLGTPTIFEEIDQHVLEAPPEAASSIETLVEYLIAGVPNDLFRIRAFFRWIAENISYNWEYLDVRLAPQEILEKKEGVCKDYCLLFEEMCRESKIRVKTISGFAKGHDYRPGHKFSRDESLTHAWSAAFVLGAWRLIDTTWGAGYTDPSTKFLKRLNEHFFLTDPEVLIWTHFPYDESERNYSKWQLLDKPMTLDEFNDLPKVTPHFFEHHLRLRSKVQNPQIFRIQTEVKLASHVPMRYKFKLFPADDIENSVLNKYVFCTLKEERLVGSFIVAPPTEGRYVLKIYTRPEVSMFEGIMDEPILRHVVTLLLECERARRYHTPYPFNDVPWGPTQNFYDFNLKLVNQPTPLVVTWGGKKKVTIDSPEPMLASHQIFDADGVEMDTKGIVLREDTDQRITFTISPSRAGFYKLLVYALPRPKIKGKWRLPLVASFMIECKVMRVADDDLPASSNVKKRRQVRVRALR